MTETISDNGDRARDRDIQAVTRCALILRLLGNNLTIRAADVEAELNLQRSTAHRYLASMASADLIERGPDGAFRPGPIANHLGATAMRQALVVEVAESVMVDLATESHETVVLSLWGGSGAVVTRVQEDPTRLINTSVRQGSILPLHAAQSIVFMAHLLGSGQTEQLLSSQPAITRAELTQSIQRARETGFGYQSMVIQGIHAVACPIFDSRNNISAAIAMVGTSQSLAAGPVSGIWQALKRTAEQISHQLGQPQSKEI